MKLTKRLWCPWWIWRHPVQSRRHPNVSPLSAYSVIWAHRIHFLSWDTTRRERREWPVECR